jgi:ABC-2 type transport system ATP-binding protein
MRQKLGLILALAHSPRLVVLDEPSSALDPLMQEVLRGHLRAMASKGHTVFFSSHTLSEVEDLCRHVAILRDGRLVVNQPLESLRKQAGYLVTLRWKSGAAGENKLQDTPAVFSVTTREPSVWIGMWRGEPSDLIEWLRGKPIEDLSITRPDLETLFREYYAIGPAVSSFANAQRMDEPEHSPGKNGGGS